MASEAEGVTGAPLVRLREAALRRRDRGDAGGARVLLEEIVALAPGDMASVMALCQLVAATDVAAAEALAVERLVGGLPSAELWSQVGIWRDGAGRAQDALAAFRQAAALAPNDAPTASNLVLALVRAGDPHAAVAQAAKALSLDPDRPDSHAHLGHAYIVLEAWDMAAAAFERALALRPAFADALIGLARAERGRGAGSRALALLDHALAIEPSSRTALSDLAILSRETGDRDTLRRTRAALAALGPEARALKSNLLMDAQYDPDIPDAALADAAFAWGREMLDRTPVAPAPRGFDRSPDRPLRIGYVSADFYRHPVGWLGGGAIRAHDRSQVQVILYANQTCTDPLTEALRASADQWVNVFGQDDDTLAQRIIGDRIDILVDLSGHTGGNRLGVFARRVAPIQVSWLGYFATTGLATIDYVLMDEAHLAAGVDALFSEEVVRLPGCRFCYSPDASVLDTPPDGDRMDAPPTFGSFNNASKLNDAVLGLWAEILTANPDSRLLLKWRSLADGDVQARYRARFEQFGVPGDRVAFEGASEHGQMLRRYWDVDVALDPFPFCGGLTTCEALVMGVPVITLPGARAVSRQTHAILGAAGLGAWSAADPAAYVRLASETLRERVGKGRDRQARQSLREHVLQSPLCDADGFARKLERFYRKAWIRFVEDRRTRAAPGAWPEPVR